ncbi:DUF6308 family protein [Dactylosporangium darangshiense]|uniref:Uncharacterized protein n=1 Tax=Dactylosporangium darangshiense TaxID=579108 RepID=A0ABP8CTJ0_9ACTN
MPDLQRYFAVGLPSCEVPPFTGGRFDRLSGGGDHAKVRDVITADDLIAVEMLNVQVPPPVSLALLEGSLGRAISAALSTIPTDVCLGDDGAGQHVADDSPADKAWHLLKECDGVGWVTAGKLLARKRPRVIPVYDEIVSCAYGTSTGFWPWLDCKLREQGGVLAHRLAELRDEAGLSDEISALRILDVVIWMRHRAGHAGHGCTGVGDDDTSGPTGDVHE